MSGIHKNRKEFPFTGEKKKFSLSDLNRDVICHNISNQTMNNKRIYLDKLYIERKNGDFELVTRGGYRVRVHKFMIASHSNILLNSCFKISNVSIDQRIALDNVKVNVTSLAPKSLGSKPKPYSFGSSSVQIARPQASNSFQTDFIDSYDQQNLEKSYIFEYYSETCVELLVELCYYQVIDWTKFQLESIIESLEMAKKYEMDYAKNEILTHLNRTKITQNNKIELKRLCQNWSQHLQ